MRVKVDRSGRMVIPLQVRRGLGIPHGGEVDLLDTPDGALLRPTFDPCVATDEHGLLTVAVGRRVTAGEVRDAVVSDRDDRGVAAPDP